MNSTTLDPQAMAGLAVRGQRDAAARLWRTPDDLVAWSTSAVAEARSAVGYALRWALPRPDAPPSALVDRLVNDDEWTVREAATFGVRDALIEDYDLVAPTARRWAGRGATDREHRAFLVAARQPRRQRADAVAELLGLLRVPLSDPAPYVRGNVAFCLHYLGRTHPDALVGRLVGWAGETDEWLQRACLVAITPALTDAVPVEVRRVVTALRGSAHRFVKRRADAITTG